MFTPITFYASGLPKGQPRPRAFARNMGGGKFAARVYDSGTAEGWKAQVAVAAKPHLPNVPLSTPLAVSLAFQMPRPKGHSGKHGLKESAPKHFTGKPDCDNLSKAVLDALTQVGMWTDDSIICRLHVWKDYAFASCGCQIVIKEVPLNTTH